MYKNSLFPLPHVTAMVETFSWDAHFKQCGKLKFYTELKNATKHQLNFLNDECSCKEPNTTKEPSGSVAQEHYISPLPMLAQV